MSKLIKKSDPQTLTMQEKNAIPPRVDIYENADQYLVVADVPGISSKELDVRYAEGQLTLSARISEEVLNKVGRTDYFRQFTVPDEIDSERISAALEQGVLSLRLPKRESVKPRRIEVKAA